MGVTGESDAIDSILQTSSLRPYKVWHVGDERIQGNGKAGIHESSGFNIDISKNDELSEAIKDAIAFLNSWKTELQKLCQTQGLEPSVIDFGLFCGIHYFAHHDHLPATLIQLAAESGLAIELSHYRSDYNAS